MGALSADSRRKIKASSGIVNMVGLAGLATGKAQMKGNLH